MFKPLVLTGKKFGRLKVISEISERTTHGSIKWNCVCDCGNKTVVRGDYLVKGSTASCGCLQREASRKANTRHGKSDTPEYKIWKVMIQRCTNPKSVQYEDYGGRGIKVCDRWKNSFENFITDVGSKPEGKHALKRSDTNGNYEPNNCQWIARKDPTDKKPRSRSRVKEVENNKTASEWSLYFGKLDPTDSSVEGE
jgi:hypothetical protein